MRKAFTLIELLVVIAIITVLMALVMPQVGKSIRSAQETACRTNLKNLQVACINHANDRATDGDQAGLPYAGSFEAQHIDGRWYERRGWISWVANSAPTDDSAPVWSQWPNDSRRAGLMRDASTDREETEFAIRHGTLFPYTSRELGVFRCPAASRVEGRNPLLSYVMSEFFRFQGRPSWHPRNLSWIGTRESMGDETPEASRLLLFAEAGPGAVWQTGSPQTGRIGTNSVLAVSSPNSTAYIGAHHDGPGNSKMGLVIFLDGHIEKVFPEVNGKNIAYYLIRGLRPED